MTSLSFANNNLKVMIVAPGANFSTYDMYKYYTAAFKHVLGAQNAVGFPYHSWIEYHMDALSVMPNKPESEEDRASVAITYASRELIADISIEMPDVVLFIDGTRVPPPIYNYIKNMRKRCGYPRFIGAYLTDEPYISDLTKGLISSLDFIFCNDKQVVDDYGNRNMWYLPHSYSEDVHYPGEESSEYASDVFFCGTVYPERLEIFSGVDWSGIDAALCGYWGITGIPDELKDVAVNAMLPNQELARYYRGSKVGINIHRTLGSSYGNNISSGQAYSVGPRVIEAAACGLPQVSDSRPELLHIFGDSILTFTTAEELQSKIKYLLSNDDVRYNMRIAAMEAVAGMTYKHRAKVLSEKFIEAKEIANHGG